MPTFNLTDTEAATLQRLVHRALRRHKGVLAKSKFVPEPGRLNSDEVQVARLEALEKRMRRGV